MTVVWIDWLLGKEVALDWSRKYKEHEYVFEWHQKRRVAWRGSIISIYDRGYGVGKGHRRYEVYFDGKREKGTKICDNLGIEYEGDSAPRKLWNRYEGC